MRFRVRRTSVRYGANVSPCDEATKGKIEVWDCRTFKSPEDHDARCGQKWLSRGVDHGFTYQGGEISGIRRRLTDVDCTAWFIEIGTLEELMAFSAKYGELVLSRANEDGSTPEIEIYDDYRE